VQRIEIGARKGPAGIEFSQHPCGPARPDGVALFGVCWDGTPNDGSPDPLVQHEFMNQDPTSVRVAVEDFALEIALLAFHN
jgi:hypothetical protein